MSTLHPQARAIQAIWFAILLTVVSSIPACGGGCGFHEFEPDAGVNYRAAGQPDRDGRATSNFFGGGKRNAAPDLPVAKKRGQYQRSERAAIATPPTASTDNGTKFDVVVSNYAGSVTSTMATLTVNPVGVASTLDVVTYHYDNLRSGQNLNETTLTTGNVNQSKFGKLGELMVDGKVDAQPLYLSNVSITGVGMKNVLYVVTEHGSVYAFDGDNVSGTAANPLWQISTQLAGEIPSDDRGCGQVTPEIGITSTPVIDRTRGAIYVIAVCERRRRELLPPHSRAGSRQRQGTLRRFDNNHRNSFGQRRRQLEWDCDF